MRFIPIFTCILALTLAPAISAGEKKKQVSITIGYGDGETGLMDVWNRGKNWIQEKFNSEEKEEEPTTRRRLITNRYQPLNQTQDNQTLMGMTEKEFDRCLRNNIICCAFSSLCGLGGCGIASLFCLPTGVILGAAADSLLHALQNNGTLSS